MDRNSAIGLTLIALILIIYFQFFAAPPAVEPETITSEQPAVQQSTPGVAAIEQAPAADLAIGGIPTIEARNIQVETDDLLLEFSNQGAVLRKVTLKEYLTYNKEPLVLLNEKTNRFSLLNKYNGNEVDLYQIGYEHAITKVNDTTKVVFVLKDSLGVLLKHVYSIPPKGYQIQYIIEDARSSFISSDHLLYTWNQLITQKERDPKETYNHTAINYYSISGGFDGLSERSSDTERDLIEKPVKWVAITEKFFTAAFLANNHFLTADVKTSPSAADDIVKEAQVQLLISGSDIREGKAAFRYYLGPNKYNVLKKVDTDFSRNLYLGWPPVIWVNKFIIIPLFQLFEKFIGNYGIIIILIVLVIKLALTPLSYRSYLSMAKMKVLKPELDQIKEQHGDDMTKVQQEQMKLYQQVGVNPISGC
ncbi:MAG TPA: membrane protein insertase YidC, partial [Cyclobacteriaceae bacterium]|nr:membrane protein insertase YidC [Cyclobacteriaceae bacterium]